MAFSRAPLRRNDQRDRDLQEYLAHRPHWIRSSPRCLTHRRRIFLVLACARNSPQGDSPNDRHFAPRIILLSTLQFCSGWTQIGCESGANLEDTVPTKISVLVEPVEFERTLQTLTSKRRSSQS